MFKSISRAIALLALALVPFTAASAQEDDAKIVAAVPTEVADVVTGGSWSADKQGGFYRALVVMTGTQETFSARVFLQWLALSETNPIPTVVASVPIIVAVNKIDKPEAKPENVMRQLSEHGLLSEAWGGDTQFVQVSAKTKQGIDSLLEAIFLQARDILRLARGGEDAPAARLHLARRRKPDPRGAAGNEDGPLGHQRLRNQIAKLRLVAKATQSR